MTAAWVIHRLKIFLHKRLSSCPDVKPHTRKWNVPFRVMMMILSTYIRINTAIKNTEYGVAHGL